MRKTRMKPVIQQEVTGCGIASVAALAGVTYREAKAVANRLGIYAEDRSLWSNTRYVRMLLKHYGIVAGKGETPFRTWAALPDLALLSIKWHLEGGKPFWHWVVYWCTAAGPVVLDSKKVLKTNTRRDFGRIRPKWFIPVRNAEGIS